MCLPISWLVVGGFSYYLVTAFVRHRSSVCVDVAGSGLWFHLSTVYCTLY